MTLENSFTTAAFELKKVRLEKGKIYPLTVKNPFILFTPQEGIEIFQEGEKKRTVKREEMVFLPTGLSCVLSAGKTGEASLFTLSDPLFFFCRYVSNLPQTNETIDCDLFHSLPLFPTLQKFFDSILIYQKEQMLSGKLMEIKTAELFTLLKLLYQREELIAFFAPLLCPTHSFKMMVLSSYKKIKTVEEFSQKAGICASSFNRQFHKVFGVSPYKWMIQKKIEALTGAIVHSSRSLKQIAFEFEFSSLSQMIDFCKKHTGQTPGEIRKKTIGKKS